MSKRRLPTLNWLRTFEAAARHGSFTGAAEELGVTPAAISQQVKQLEDWLGSPLFTRLPRGLVPTDAGLGYLPMVRHAFDHRPPAPRTCSAKSAAGRSASGSPPRSPRPGWCRAWHASSPLIRRSACA